MVNLLYYSRTWCSLCLMTLVFMQNVSGQSADEIHITPPEIPQARPRDLTSSPNEVNVGHLKPLRSDVDLVLVPVTVTDELNHPVMGLKQEAFRVYEDNEEQQIQSFSSEDGPISVGLLLDLSKSMANKFVIEREAVEEFCKNANSQDDYFVITFADRPKLLASSTQSIDDIQQKLAADIPDGHTALLDAIYMAIARTHAARYERRALLVISDGGDNHSRYGLKEIKTLVEEAKVEVYALGIFDSVIFRSFEELMGKRWLSEITDLTGGRTVTAGDLGKVPEIAADISREMRNQYVLGYRPRNAPRDGKWRRIKVQVTASPEAGRVRPYYKKGYLAAGR
jgi:Ca-activated chloride channel homolog